LLAGVFAVGARLGRGGMGEVYEATDTRSRQRVAVKMLHLYLTTQARSLTRFSREAAILRGLGSPHIVRVLAVEQDEGRPFMVLELLVGETLKQRTDRSGALNDAEVARLAWQLAAALDDAHRQGVVHRDLNPSNVFLCDSSDGFTVKVLDFGISKVESSLSGMTQDGALLGTPAFMAPEQAEGRSREVTPRTDIYAMGLVLFVALTGRSPFEDTSLAGLLKRVRDDGPTIASARPDLDQRVDDALRRATSKNPEDRHGSAGELAAVIVAALGLEVDFVARSSQDGLA
jgi:serine/threonine-protein kinase